jgi:hypothetical protein
MLLILPHSHRITHHATVADNTYLVIVLLLQ